MNIHLTNFVATFVIYAMTSCCWPAEAIPTVDHVEFYRYHTNVTVNQLSERYQYESQHKATPPASTSKLKRLSPDEYQSIRAEIMRLEASKQLGADIKLDKNEMLANELIMRAKTAEYNEGLVTPHLFKPSQHFFSVIEAISASPLFKILTKMPKGGVLHAHDSALCSTDFVIELTYRSDLWMCIAPGSINGVALKFSRMKPTDTFDISCEWKLLAVVREEKGSVAVDDYLRQCLTLYPREDFIDNNAAWDAFHHIFRLLYGLLLYKPVWSDYYYQALKEFYEDGIQYLEVRTTLPILYDMDGASYRPIDTVQTYVEALKRFKRDYPEFIGSRMIYAPPRKVDQKQLEEYIQICIEIESKYPDFIAGFDLVGQEERGGALKDFIPQLLSMPEHINFFFHAGETNWYGSAVDENLIDAVMLGTKRIGHGFGIVKHPLILEMVKVRNIAIEVNPISNQVLQLVRDYRNHPAALLFSDNYPVVISSDDPAFWKAKPLTHDFYMAFLGIASAHTDLRLLKKLAINSIQYSSLNEVQKASALIKWQRSWNNFIDWLINGQQE